MSLIYRGHTYQRTAASVKTEPKTIQMIYRGQTFECTPRPILPCPNVYHIKDFDPDTMEKLIYRGRVFNYLPPQPETYRKPRVMNWRYEMIAQGATA
jgi:hypothetical protein